MHKRDLIKKANFHYSSRIHSSSLMQIDISFGKGKRGRRNDHATMSFQLTKTKTGASAPEIILSEAKYQMFFLSIYMAFKKSHWLIFYTLHMVE